MTWPAVGVVLAALGGQAFWIAHALAGVAAQLHELREDVKSLRDDVVRDHGERIARLEERTRA